MFNENTMSALHKWLGRSTWYTSHGLDQDCFFAFVHAAWIEESGLWDEMAVRNWLLEESRRLDPSLSEEHRAKVIDNRRREASIILQFLAFTKENRLDI